jgi:hypothetical protein
MLRRTRHLFIRQQTPVMINAIRAHLAEFGIVAPAGRKGVEELLDVVADAGDQRVPELARGCLAALGAQLKRSFPVVAAPTGPTGAGLIMSVDCGRPELVGGPSGNAPNGQDAWI